MMMMMMTTTRRRRIWCFPRVCVSEGVLLGNVDLGDGTLWYVTACKRLQRIRQRDEGKKNLMRFKLVTATKLKNKPIHYTIIMCLNKTILKLISTTFLPQKIPRKTNKFDVFIFLWFTQRLIKDATGDDAADFGCWWCASTTCQLCAVRSDRLNGSDLCWF
jgi:hypothetical protein